MAYEEYLLEYLTKDTYPPTFTKSEKRKLRAKCKKYRVKNGKLVWLNRKHESREVIIGHKNRDTVLQDFHDGRGHMGIERTYTNMSKLYFWKNMYGAVSNYIRSCTTCQKASAKFVKDEQSDLHPIPVTATWRHIGLDLITMPRTVSGNCCILSIVDYFSKWAQAVALPNKSAQSVAQALYNICLTMGFPEIYSSDQGREFVNSMFKELIDAAGGSHRISTAYHPQTNGLVERFNQTIQNMLLKACSAEQDDWDDFLTELVFAYNTSQQKSTKMAPFQVMFGRRSVLSHTGTIHDDLESHENPEYIEGQLNSLLNIRRIINGTVKANIEHAQMKQVHHFKKRKQGKKAALKAGEKVLLFNKRKATRKGSKLEQSWLGPYVITSLSSSGVAVLENMEGKPLRQHHNVLHLKRFVERNGNPDESDVNCTAQCKEAEPIDDQCSPKVERSPIFEGGSPKTPATMFDESSPMMVDETSPKTDECSEDHEEYDPGSLQYFTPVDHPWQLEKSKVVTKTPWRGHPHGSFICLPILCKPSKIESMMGDGNCFFRAISYAIFGLQSRHRCVRNSIVLWMTIHHDKIKEHFGDTYLENSSMDSNGKWATEAEILSTAAILETDIQIWCKSGGDLKWLRYKSETLGKTSSTEKSIHLTNGSGVHFDYVLYTGHT